MRARAVRAEQRNRGETALAGRTGEAEEGARPSLETVPATFTQAA